MNALENFVSPALTRALGWTLLHSLWQGALVAAVLAGALLLLRRQRAEVRYVASVGALGLVVALAGITFGMYFRSGTEAGGVLASDAGKAVRTAPLRQTERPGGRVLVMNNVRLTATAAKAAAQTAGVAAAPMGAGPAQTHSATQSLIRSLQVGLRYFDNHLPLLVVGWLLGLLAMSLRMLGGLLYVQRLRRYRVQPLSAAWQERLAALAARSGVRRPVALLESALVQVPLVVGHLRPVILLPLGMVAGLSPACLEAILAHELAHVLRRDYLVNLLQTVAETLFFYHPAVWFVGRCVRTERENCCDDTATALCGDDPVRLARALTALAEWTHSAALSAAPRLALAAIGTQGALLNRVRRLVQRRPAAPTLVEGFMAGALVLGGLGLLGSSVALAGPLALSVAPAEKPAAAQRQAAQRQAAPAQTTPQPAAPDASKRAVAAAAPVTAALAIADSQTKRSKKQALAHEGMADDTIIRVRPGRGRDRREVVAGGRDLAPPLFPGSPGTVVITKDKKGRLTDLVVNGQRVETATGKGKTKSKSKGRGGDADAEQRVEVIRVNPSFSPQSQTFVYRGNYDEAQVERVSPRVDSRLRSSVNPQIYMDVLPQTEQLKRLRPLGQSNGAFRLQSPGTGARPDLETTRSALRAAERGLREASAVKNLPVEQRKRLQNRLEDVQAQLKRLDNAPRPFRFDGPTSDEGRDDAFRLRQDELRQRNEEVRERSEEMRQRIQEARQEMRQRIVESPGRSGREELLVNEMLKDGLIKDRNNFQLSLTARDMVVDGRTQPKKVLDKYLKLVEKSSGHKMSASSSVMLSRSGNGGEVARLPRPPRPPRAPHGAHAPAALDGLMLPPPPPAAPDAPAPPPPPPAPSLDTQKLRDELRKDGLIGADDKSFQFQINPSGLTVNGKPQPAEVTAKYRKLMGREDGTYNVTISNN